MPQAGIGLSARDRRAPNEGWWVATRHRTSEVRCRIGLRGPSSFPRQLTLFAFVKASEDPAGFLRAAQSTFGPSLNEQARPKAGAGHRDSMTAAQKSFFPRTVSSALSFCPRARPPTAN
jgi:hypothetical protein